MANLLLVVLARVTIYLLIECLVQNLDRVTIVQDYELPFLVRDTTQVSLTHPVLEAHSVLETLTLLKARFRLASEPQSMDRLRRSPFLVRPR